MFDGEESNQGQVHHTRFLDRWEDVGYDELRDALRNAARALASALDVAPEHLGILPAVYFPRLRMGSVICQSWGASQKDTELAMPWNPTYIPPPFTCFAPPISEGEEQDVGLITRIASFVDRFFDPEATSRPWVARTPRDTYVGTVTWTAGKNRIDGVVDADQLVAAGVRQVSATYSLPSASQAPLYVPMLYINSAESYAATEFDGLVHAAARSGGSSPQTHAIYDALLAIARAARVRASQWLNPKTHLLNQAGFDGLKDDIQRRVASGELYAECFFDIDAFKAKNDRFGYVGADLIAANLVDRVLLAVQRSVAEEYAAFRAQQPTPFGKPNGFRALIAHVSGDEFKFFARSNLTAAAHDPTEEDRARKLGTLIVEASAATISAGAHRRLERVFPAFSPTTLFQNREVVANVPATVSLGLAVVATDDSWPLSVDDFDLYHYPIDEGLLSRARAALDELDGVAERALFGAKRFPSKVLLSTDLLAFGGTLSITADDDARLLLGTIDGVREGAEFDVFAAPDRDGQPLAVVRAEALSTLDKRTAPVRFVHQTVKPRREVYYVRARRLVTSETAQPAIAVLSRDN